MVQARSRSSASESPGEGIGEVLEFMQQLWSLDHSLQQLSRTMRSRYGITGPQRLVLRVVGTYPGISAGLGRGSPSRASEYADRRLQAARAAGSHPARFGRRRRPARGPAPDAPRKETRLPPTGNRRRSHPHGAGPDPSEKADYDQGSAGSPGHLPAGIGLMRRIGTHSRWLNTEKHRRMPSGTDIPAGITGRRSG